MRVRYHGLVAAAILLILYFSSLFFGSSVKSPAWDETGHIASGVAYVQLGTLEVNPQHPPLLKALSGLSLTIGGARWPDTPEARELLKGAWNRQWEIGSLILARKGLDGAVQWARLPLMLIAALGGLVVFLWGRRLAGEWAGLAGLLLYVADPVIAAHGYLVTMDVGLGVFSLLFLYCLWRYVCTPGRGLLIACGVTLGIALCTKFSAVVLLPVGAVLLLAGRLQSSPKVAPDALCPCGSGRKFKNCHAHGPSLGERLGPAIVPMLSMLAVAVAVIVVVYRGHPGAYYAGLTQVNADHQANYYVSMAGMVARKFHSYFAVAYLMKEPIASILLAAAGLVLLLRGRESGLRDKLFLLLPPAAYFLLHVWKADNLGIRYIIPCLPFAHLLGGIALASMVRKAWLPGRVLAAAAALWLVVAAAGIYPDALSYFNESACLLDDPGKLGLDGGSRCGVAWLDDSNVDWGGGLKQLKAWLANHAAGRKAQLVYFGSFPPADYNLPVELAGDRVLLTRPASGLYVVSAHKVIHYDSLVRNNILRGEQWMLRTPPTAVVGHCLYVWDFGGQ